MSNSIVDALKKKGSAGGNTIMEAIESLPAGGSGGSSDIATIVISATGENTYAVDKTYSELVEIANSNKPIAIYSAPLHVTLIQPSAVVDSSGDVGVVDLYGFYINRNSLTSVWTIAQLRLTVDENNETGMNMWYATINSGTE